MHISYNMPSSISVVTKINYCVNIVSKIYVKGVNTMSFIYYCLFICLLHNTKYYLVKNDYTHWKD